MRTTVSGLLGRTAVLVLAVMVSACGTDEPASETGPATADGIVRLSPEQIRSAGIRVEILERRSIQRVVAVPGSVQPPDTAQAVIGAIVEGRVVDVHVLPGDVVRAGQPLVEIHSHELSEAQRDLSTALAEVAFHRNAFQRSEELFEAEAVSLEEVERRRASLEAAQAERVRAQEMVEHLHPSAEGNATAVASRAGTVFSVHARMGQAVVPGDPLVEMGSTDVLWVTAYVPEQTATMLMPGDTVRVRFTAPVAEVGAHLVRAGNFVDPANRSVEMRFELDSIPRGVRPGTFAVVDVTTSEPFEGVEVPEAAAVRLGDRDVVFVVDGQGEYRALDVEVEPLAEGRVAVRGVPEGTEVVVNGAYFLKAAAELADEAAEVEAGGEADAERGSEGGR